MILILRQIRQRERNSIGGWRQPCRLGPIIPGDRCGGGYIHGNAAERELNGRRVPSILELLLHGGNARIRGVEMEQGVCVVLAGPQQRGGVSEQGDRSQRAHCYDDDDDREGVSPIIRLGLAAVRSEGHGGPARKPYISTESGKSSMP